MPSTSLGRVFCWTSLPHLVVGEPIPTLHPGTSCAHTLERLSDLDGL